MRCTPINATFSDIVQNFSYECATDAVASKLRVDPEFAEGSDCFDGKEVCLVRDECGAIAQYLSVGLIIFGGDVGEVALFCEPRLAQSFHFPSVLAFTYAQRVKRVTALRELFAAKSLYGIEVVDSKSTNDHIIVIHSARCTLGALPLAAGCIIIYVQKKYVRWEGCVGMYLCVWLFNLIVICAKNKKINKI